MLFRVIDKLVEATDAGILYLVQDNWDDQFKFETAFLLVTRDNPDALIEIGLLKIGEFGLTPSQRRPSVPSEFHELPQVFFSLGLTEDYYETIARLGPSVSSQIFNALRDCAYDLEIFHAAENQQVTQLSLLRSVSPETVKGRFHRIATGNAELTRYDFGFNLPSTNSLLSGPTLAFEVVPYSLPPSNIHVLIGRNGVGKTTALNWLAQSLASDADASEVSKSGSSDDTKWHFPTVVSVAFSAFDPFVPLADGVAGRHGKRWLGKTEQRG